jgi:hypothetical protein
MRTKLHFYSERKAFFGRFFVSLHQNESYRLVKNIIVSQNENKELFRYASAYMDEYGAEGVFFGFSDFIQVPAPAARITAVLHPFI